MIEMIDITKLKPHEKVDEERVDILFSEIVEANFWTQALIVDRDTLIIMDGHHRYAVGKKLGLARLPCRMASYDDRDLSVTDWITGKSFPVDRIINAANTGHSLPVKTTRHVSSSWDSATKFKLDALM